MELDYKSLFFEVFSAGFEAALTGKDICYSYNNWYKTTIERVLKDGSTTD